MMLQAVAYNLIRQKNKGGSVLFSKSGSLLVSVEVFPYGRHDSGGYLNNNKNFYKLCYCIGCQPCCSQPPNWMQQFRCFFPRHNCTSLILYLLEQGGLTTDLSFWPTWLSIFSQLIISAIFGFTLGETIHLFTSKQTGKPYDEVFGVAACIISAMTFFADLFHHCSQPSRSISQSLYCGMSVKSSAMMFLKTSVTMALISTTLFVAFIIARVADREEVVEESDKRELKFGTIGLAVGLFGATSLKTIMACMNHRQTGCVRPTNVLSILKRMTMFSTQGDEMATSLAPDDAVRLPLI